MPSSAREAADHRVTLLVFSDDWGRHPSSCQHLVRQLLPRYQVYWVNTTGTRPPRFDLLTLERGIGKLSSWLFHQRPAAPSTNPRVLEPLMWPSFRSHLGRQLNCRLVARAIHRAQPKDRISLAVTTIPIVSDLIGRLPVFRWVYYCVDDLSQWPGLDMSVLASMERELVARVDAIVAVSGELVKRMAVLGRQASLLTHGVDLEHWRNPPQDRVPVVETLRPPRIVFWGVVDRRLDTPMLQHLAERIGRGSIVLIGPANNPDPALDSIPVVHRIGPLPYRLLPRVAQLAAVLIMPYADLPATRTMQPLKLKEYLATLRPVVVSNLAAVGEWSDACDIASSAENFAEAVLTRINSDAPQHQLEARHRLEQESWSEKARIFERVLLGEEE